MLSEDHQRMMLAYLSGLVEGFRLRSSEDLAALPAPDLLRLAGKVDDAALGLFVQLLKTAKASANSAGSTGSSLFEKLMGDHEEENRPLVDAFFSRYLKAVLSSSDESRHFNPLEVYLPPQTFGDLAFVQSRQPFFLRQTIAVINEYLDEVFTGTHDFQVGEQDKAWSYFWGKVMAH